MTTTELEGIAHELKFWQGFVKTDRFLKGWVAPIKTPELHQEVYDFIKSVPNDSIMDVGTGVVSILHGTTPEHTQHWVDPLGKLYELVFDYKKHNLCPPAAIPAEEITKENVYDIVHCSNALDHTQNPVQAVQRMLAAVKPGGYLILQGFENEGSFEHWKGFHKWNISVDEDESILTCTDENNDEYFLLGKPHQTFFKELDKKNWYIWIQQKL